MGTPRTLWGISLVITLGLTQTFSGAPAAAAAMTARQSSASGSAALAVVERACRQNSPAAPVAQLLLVPLQALHDARHQNVVLFQGVKACAHQCR